MALEAKKLWQDIYVARQPVFDGKERVWAEKFLFRARSDADSAEMTTGTEATLNVAAHAFLDAADEQEETLREQFRTIINFTPRAILDQVPYALPPERTVIELLDDGGVDETLIPTLLDLKADGYTLAVDVTPGTLAHPLVLDLADVLDVDVLEPGPGGLEPLVQRLSGRSARLLAKRVETRELFEQAKGLGFHYFQGFFFCRPVMVVGRKLSSSEVTRLQLFRQIEAEDPDFDQLAATIQADVSISYRLLRYLNSASFGFRREIDSIRQAIVLLGWKPLRNWLRLIILTDLNPPEKSSELPYLCAQRGKFFEILADDRKSRRSGELFLLGLFSLLDAMLGIPMDEIVDHLPLEQELKDALCGMPGRYGKLLELTQCLEMGRWARLGELLTDMELDPGLVASAHFEALGWAREFFTLTPARP